MIRAGDTAVNKMDKSPCLMEAGDEAIWPSVRINGKCPLKRPLLWNLIVVLSPHCLASHTRGTVIQMNKNNYATTYTLAINRRHKSRSRVNPYCELVYKCTLIQFIIYSLPLPYNLSSIILPTCQCRKWVLACEDFPPKMPKLVTRKARNLTHIRWHYINMNLEYIRALCMLYKVCICHRSACQRSHKCSEVPLVIWSKGLEKTWWERCVLCIFPTL